MLIGPIHVAGTPQEFLINEWILTEVLEIHIPWISRNLGMRMYLRVKKDEISGSETCIGTCNIPYHYPCLLLYDLKKIPLPITEEISFIYWTSNDVFLVDGTDLFRYCTGKNLILIRIRRIY